jgi:DNA-binding NtrC family response regulator
VPKRFNDRVSIEHPGVIMRKSVLLVESVDGVRALLRLKLKLTGLVVCEAASGQQGVITFAAHRKEIGVVVAGELGKPMDGGDFLEAVRKIDPTVPIFFFLGHSLPSEILEQPGVEVFLKPDGVGGLCRAVAELVATPSPATV